MHIRLARRLRARTIDTSLPFPQLKRLSYFNGQVDLALKQKTEGSKENFLCFLQW
jgi:hypothetical protein